MARTKIRINGKVEEIADAKARPIDMSWEDYEAIQEAEAWEEDKTYYIPDKNGLPNANQIPFNNGATTLESTNVGSAITELDGKVETQAINDMLSISGNTITLNAYGKSLAQIKSAFNSKYKPSVNIGSSVIVQIGTKYYPGLIVLFNNGLFGASYMGTYGALTSLTDDTAIVYGMSLSWHI